MTTQDFLSELYTLHYRNVAVRQSSAPLPRPRASTTVLLTIASNGDDLGTYGMTITATVAKPVFVDKVRVLANLIELDSADKQRVSKQLGFAKDLLDGNPECLDLKEYINQAEESLNNNNFDQALSLVENAIVSCQKLVSSKDSLSIIQGSLIEVPYIIKDNQTIIILAGETLAFILTALIVVKIVRRKKKKPTTSKFLKS